VTLIPCPHCGQTYNLTPEQLPQYAGRTINCTACGQPFTVAIPGATPVAPPPPPPPPAGAYERQAAYAAHPPVAPLKNNGMAVASLIVGIVSFCIPIIGSVVAIVLGVLGLTRTKDPAVGGKGMAITGIVLGALSVFVMPCLISIMLPSLNRARETANRVKCASNMRQIGQALMSYSANNRGALPPDLQTLANTMPAGIDATFFVCPSSNDAPAIGTPYTLGTGTLSYVYVPSPSLTKMGTPSKTIVLYEPMANHDNDGTNVLFGDGHVEFLVRTQAEPLIAAVEAGENPPQANPANSRLVRPTAPKPVER
jgi:predicted Zn finger-like uncharacterized protein/prepilin-type processing-associated H-X9-DG protein